MANAKPVYKNPQAGQALLTTIATDFRTPLLEVKFSNIVKPYYYANSPAIPRYSITCLIDVQKHKEFLKTIQGIEKNEGVETIIKNETIREDDQIINTGNTIVKFQTKENIPVYLVSSSKEINPMLMALEDELQKGEQVIVVYDILRYTKKNTAQTEHGLSFKPTAVFYYPQGQ